jgi:acylglycerol lipase
VPSTVSHVRAVDGTDLLVRHWPVDEAEAGGAWAGPPWASVLLVHGLGEHSGRYEHVGDQLTGAGLEVAAYDHRGMGGSGGRRGDVERWSQYHDDLQARLADLRAGAKGRPVVLYAHSLGGLIAAGYLIDDRPKPDLAVLSSPALDSGLPGWKKRLAPALARVGPMVSIANGIDGTTLSRDPSVAAKTADDPLCVKSSTARFGALALVEQARVREAAPRGFGIPTLVLHGEDDRLVPVGASAVFEGAPLVDRRTYPDLRHELHNEPEGPTIVDEIIGWLRKEAAGAPPGPAGPEH